MFKTNLSYKFSIVMVFVFVWQLLSMSCAFTAPTISAFSCSTTPDKTTYDGINKTTYQYNCSITVNRDGVNKLQVGIYAGALTPTKVSGAGTQTITITSPQDRFLVYGTKQRKTTGVPAAITTSSTFPAITIVKDNIRNDTAANFTFKTYFEVFDADKAGNTFQQTYRMALFDKNGILQDEVPTSPGTYYVEFVVPEVVSISSTPAPVMTFNTPAEIFGGASVYQQAEQNCVVTVRANNTWLVETKLDAKLASGSDTISGNRIYYECHAGIGYICTAGDGVRTKFNAQGGNARYISVASDPNQIAGDYTTGSSDNMTLDPVDVTITHFIRNLRPTFQPGTYINTTSFRITAPRP